MLLTARWVIVMTYFERELYANPERDDLDEMWWHLVEELQLLARPEDRKAPDWAAKIHLLSTTTTTCWESSSPHSWAPPFAGTSWTAPSPEATSAVVH
jgi:hypothetical protein